MEEKIYIVVEENVIDCNSYVTVKAFRNREDAERRFNLRIENAREVSDADAMGYTEDINKDNASIYMDGEWLENHFEITIFEEVLQ